MVRFSVLASGSRANATYVESADTRILIDCGLSYRRLRERMGSIDRTPEELSAILVTHEHSDHTAGLAVASKKLQIPLCGTSATLESLKLDTNGCSFVPLERGVKHKLGDISVIPFAVVHDASDPVGYLLEVGSLRFAQATDLGRVTPVVKEHLLGAHALVLESNHDEELLLECSYPWALKQRISSTHGHLSNHAAGAFLSELLHRGLQYVVLAHLSENSNTPEVALASVRRYLNDFASHRLWCGSPDCATPLFEVKPENLSAAAA